MRTGGVFNTTTTSVSSRTGKPPHHCISHISHTPIPYLFGGMGAMLLLVAFALLILACSSLKSSFSREREPEGDVENGDDKEVGGELVKSPRVYEEKIVVIIAGKPTFIATPIKFEDRENMKSMIADEKISKQHHQN